MRPRTWTRSFFCSSWILWSDYFALFQSPSWSSEGELWDYFYFLQSFIFRNYGPTRKTEGNPDFFSMLQTIFQFIMRVSLFSNSHASLYSLSLRNCELNLSSAQSDGSSGHTFFFFFLAMVLATVLRHWFPVIVAPVAGSDHRQCRQRSFHQ